MKSSFILLSLILTCAGCSNIVHSELVGHSMEPTIPNGSQIKIDESFPYSDLKPGDIAAYYSPKCAFHGVDDVCHRIIKADTLRGESVWIMKGDHNKHPDLERMSKENYMGEVIKIDKDT